MTAEAPSPSHTLKSRQFGRRLLVGVFLLALFSWLALRAPPESDSRLIAREFLGMGTLLSVTVYRNEDQDAASAEQAVDAVEALLTAYERRWAAWGDGDLGALNQALTEGKAVDIPEPMRPLFSAAARYGRASGGRFDVRLGRLVEVWGFNDEAHFRSEPPAADAIAQALAGLQAAPPLLDSTSRYGPAQNLRFDFGAIAKGDAVDQVVAHLREAGYPNVIVNAGGNLRAAGVRGERAWRIGIRHPRPTPQHPLLATLEIQGDEAVVTSGDYERWFEYQGQRYHHLLDPRSGMPARGLQAVTVVADNAALADAASTALFVAGAADWRDVAAALGLDRVLVVDGSGGVQATPALAARLRYAEGVAATVAKQPSSP